MFNLIPTKCNQNQFRGLTELEIGKTHICDKTLCKNQKIIGEGIYLYIPLKT